MNERASTSRRDYHVNPSMSSSSSDESTASSPNIKHIRNLSFTPRKSVTGGGTSKITDLRAHIGSEMDGEFVICDVDKFMEHYLPFVPSENHVKSCVETKLKPSGLMDKSTTSVFTAFRDTPVINKEVVGQRTEMEIYAPLEEIAKEIAEFDHPDKARTRNKFSYRNVPFDTIKSDIHGSNHKVDACFTTDEAISEKDRRLSTWGMAVPVEQKVATTEEKLIDNNQKILSANVQIMNDDTRRMFTFGITIEADQMTLWYHSRSHSAVSKSFNFVKDPERLIKVFMSFLFATEVELGYNPMVERRSDGKHIYRILQADKKTFRFYRTVKLISGYRTNNITGRMPRVWLVESYDPVTQKVGEKLVLKDVWLDSNAATERQIQNSIFEDIEAFGDGEAPSDSPGLSAIWSERKDLIRSRDYQQLFLTIKDDYADGVVSKTIAPGAQRKQRLFSSPMKAYTSKQTATRPEAGQSHPIHSAVAEDLYRAYEPKKQYWVVFKEVCRSVGELRTLGEFIDVIQQAHIALQLLYCAGWVHRDISSGNILAYRQDLNDAKIPWGGKLMDLEYAKKFPLPEDYEAAVDPKTGTPFFMASEILAKTPLYHPGTTAPQRAASPNMFKPKPTIEQTEANITGPPMAPVVHNFLHDLESLWWLILWTLTSRIQDPKCKNWLALVFQNITDLSSKRRRCFEYPIENKLSRFLPEALAPFAHPLDLLRDEMFQSYLKRELAGDVRNVDSYATIHRQVGWFLDAVQAFPTDQWRAYLLHEDPTNRAKSSVKDSKAAGTQVPGPIKVKAKRGPEQNPNLEEQGRTGSTHQGGKKSRKDQ
ncbi:hypothetical protein CVT25_006729 [Psilocybe cyanescens]|uniref:Fungal-type protein kinase domain-containing protein n=1 Tax=Psilocybe cyanescens TaxID=93625 RepID=A0A409X480_PSICY|nr:hypothetical protein CVT25_006729 [Psilocybe cyanescens]